MENGKEKKKRPQLQDHNLKKDEAGNG